MGENAEIEYSITEGEGLDMFDVITDQETQEGIITVKKVMHFLNTIQIKAFTLLWSSSNWGQLHLTGTFLSSPDLLIFFKDLA